MRKLLNRIFAPTRDAEVSILIPAYEAESFIDRTLYFARGQTFAGCTIIVSVDAGEDRTADHVRRHAGEDARIEVAVHERRLGWAGNVNYLLGKAATPFFFIYFHDDILLPQYTEVLLKALKSRPDAASAHCNMGHFGGSNHISIGHNYAGSPVDCLLTFFLAPERGSPLRSLIRTEAAGSLRLPENAVSGLWANEPFLMELVTTGPAVHVNEALYLRWDKRVGGLTDGWRNLSIGDEMSGHRTNLAKALDIINGVASDERDRAALTFALYLNFFPRLRRFEKEIGNELFKRPEDLHPDFAELNPELPAEIFGEEISLWASEKWQSVGQDARHRGLQRAVRVRGATL